MKPLQVILKNEYIIYHSGRKKYSVDNSKTIEKKLQEGYIVTSVHTESNCFHDSEYSNKVGKRNIYFVEIYILQLNKNL